MTDPGEGRAETVRWAKALAHPLRLQIVVSLLQTEVVNSSALARHIGVIPNTLAYHFRRLQELGIVGVEKRQARQGFTFNDYRLKSRPAAEAALAQVGELIPASLKVRAGLTPRTARRLATIGSAVRASRKAHGIRLTELARQAEIPASTLEAIENGEIDARVTTLLNIGDALDVSLPDLLRSVS